MRPALDALNPVIACIKEENRIVKNRKIFNLSIANKALCSVQGLIFSKASGCLYKSLFHDMLLRRFQLEGLLVAQNSKDNKDQLVH